jgi:hypothetical protein
MKIFDALLLSFLANSIASCQELRQVTCTILSGDGTPVNAANVHIAYIGQTAENSSRTKGLSNSLGVFVAKGHAPLRMKVIVDKEGYYPSVVNDLNRMKDHNVNIVLYKKKNPIPLYVRKTRITPPVLKEKLGYDLKIRDWVKPHGQGEKIDIYFKVVYEERARYNFDYSLEVSFPNENDGIQEFYSSNFSVLKSPYKAPLKGYIKGWIQKTKRRPDRGRSGNRDKKRNFWMRVRSEVDGVGNIVSAHYIKMYGDFPDLQIYYNPIPNDRNLEFDPTKNLFNDLKSYEKVRQP